MTIPQDRVASLQGQDVYDRNGDKIGTVGQVWADETGQPSWLSVNTGFFGMNESLVPLQGAQWQGERLTVPYDKDMVKDAPNVDVSAEDPMDDDQMQRLYRHYNLTWGGGGTGYATEAGGTGYTSETSGGGYATEAGRTGYTCETGYQAGAAGTAQYVGREAGERDDAMTRSEEELRVGTEREQVGKARLRKYVVTENVQTTVPVQREEVRVEREPITDANREQAYSGPDITEAEHEVTLHAERPVVDKEAVPVERVRLDTETVTEEQTVGGEVRKERIEAETPDQARRDVS